MKHFFGIISLLISLSTVGQNNIVDVLIDSSSHQFVDPFCVKAEHWDTLAQPVFWKDVMSLTPDSCVVNVADTREVLGFDSFLKWQVKTEDQKQIYKDSVRKANCLEDDVRIYITSGKSNFYDFEKVMPSLSRGIEVFEEENTDPWYAQAILLIESPGKLEYSNVGAFGPFQLMKTVARAHGLKVNSVIDERKDFDKSAKGAASLVRNVCIPEAKRILNKHDIKYSTNDIWFKLFVLHIYHAGAGNVDGVLSVIKPESGGQELITQMWKNEWGGFKNASQNYTQVALAAFLKLEDTIYQNCDHIYECNLP